MPFTFSHSDTDSNAKRQKTKNIINYLIINSLVFYFLLLAINLFKKHFIFICIKSNCNFAA